MKPFYIAFLLSLLVSSQINGQWKRVGQLPAVDYYSMVYQNHTLYASGANKLYISRNEGSTWDSTAIIAQGVAAIDDFILFDNGLYAGSYGMGVFRSTNNGASWQNITIGIDRYINEFFTWKGQLYASTDDGGVYRLAENKQRWEPFKNGFTWNTSAALSGNSACMVAAGGANGSIFRYTEETGLWEEYYVRGNISPGMNISDIISVNDTLFAATSAGIYSSTNGRQWTNTGTIRNGSYVFLANVKEGIFCVVNHGLNEVSVFKRSKEVNTTPWVQTDFFQNTVVYELLVTPRYLWQARMDGLYYRSLGEYGVTPPFQENDINFSISRIYPNPAAQRINFNITVSKPTQFSATILNTNGQILLQPFQSRILTTGSNLFSVSQNLPVGVYYLSLYVDGRTYTKNFVIAPK